MNTICTYNDTRDEVLIAYLYNDIDPAVRPSFEAHLASCAICRRELDELAVVRGQIAKWSPPDLAGRALNVEWFARPEKPRPAGVWKKLGEMPAWAQIAAAMLFLGVSAAVANVNVTYNSNGLTVRTGWLKSVESPVTQPVVSQEAQPAPWRTDLAALEQQLRTDLRPSPVQPVASTSAADQEALLRRVRALINESEQKQQRELALRIAEVDGYVQAQRFADLRNIERNLTAFRSNTGNDMLRLYNMTNELAVKVSQAR